MKPSHVKAALKKCVEKRRPAFLWGSPGVGKSEIVAQVARAQSLTLIDLRLSLLDPVDLRGIPTIQDGQTIWQPPAFFPRSGKGILFLDELNLAAPSVQAAAYQLILNFRLGEYTLPEGWIPIAAGNREQDRAYTHRMAPPLANRFVHINFDVDLADWVDWALDNNIMPEIIAFIRHRPNLLNSFDPARNEKAFPTPRSWAFVSQLLTEGIDKEIEFEFISGIVGEGPASEFIGFLNICRNIPDPDLILKDPAHADVPEDPAINYALCVALQKRANAKTFPSIVAYADRMASHPDAKKRTAEFGMLLISDIVRQSPEYMKTQAFVDWAVKNSWVLS